MKNKEQKRLQEFKELNEITKELEEKKIGLKEFLKDIYLNNRWSEFSVLDSIKLTYDPKLKNTSHSTLNKKLNSYGFYYSSEQELWFNKSNPVQLELLDFMNLSDVEELIDEIAADRYYDSFKNGFHSEENEVVHVEMNKNLYEEYVELSSSMGLEENDLLNRVLLQALEILKPVDKRKEFCLMKLEEKEGIKAVEFVKANVLNGYDQEQLVEYVSNTGDLTIDGYLEAMKQEQIRKENFEKNLDEIRKQRELLAEDIGY